MASLDLGRDDASYERLLVRLQPFGSGLANGLTSHAPMVAEVLLDRGRLDIADAWLDRYLTLALPRGESVPAVEASGWQAALGRPDLENGWIARVEADIALQGWRPALAAWTDRLAPGFAAAAAHGVIRTAHAARALGRADTGPRRAELAAGLALWASNWQPLPGDPLAGSGTLAAREALRRVPLVPCERRRNGGSITAALGVLEAEPGFANALGSLDRAPPPEVLALDLATAFAHAFLEQVHSPLYAIVFTHAITGVEAVRRLAPCLSAPATARLLAYAWQTGAALYACYGEADAVRPPCAAPTVAKLVDAAVAHGDEHVIKLADACVDLHGAGADPVVLEAAARAVEVLPPG